MTNQPTALEGLPEWARQTARQYLTPSEGYDGWSRLFEDYRNLCETGWSPDSSVTSTLSALARCKPSQLWDLATQVDPVAWAMRYVKVQHPRRGLVPFVCWDYQADLARDNRRALLVNKARQLGISTVLCACRIAHKVTHIDGITIGIVSRKGDTAAELMSMVTGAVLDAQEQEPDFPHIDKQNEMRLTFRGRTVNGQSRPWRSRVICETASPKALRTYTAGEVLLDEYAFMEYPRQILRSARPTLTRGGTLVIVSTPPDEPGTPFEQEWNRKESLFVKYKLPWPVCPDFTEEWAEKTRGEMGVRDFAQEHECDFAAAGRPYFPPYTVNKCFEVYEGNGRPAAAETGGPEENREYLVAADVAGGGEDFTVVGVWDVTREPWTLVWAEDYERIGARELQVRLEATAHHWGAALVIDASGMGEMLLGQLNVPAMGLRIVGGYSWRENDNIITVAKDRLLAHASVCMDQGRVALPRIARMDQELRQYVLPDTHIACDWVMMVAIALWRADKALSQPEPVAERITMADLFPNFRPVRAITERMATDDHWARGI